jgi:hypothetical protein
MSPRQIPPTESRCRSEERWDRWADEVQADDVFALLDEAWFKSVVDPSTGLRTGSEAAIYEDIEAHNAEPKPFIWTAKASDILAKVIRARAALNKSTSN